MLNVIMKKPNNMVYAAQYMDENAGLIINALGQPKLRSIQQFLEFPFFCLSPKNNKGKMDFISPDCKQVITVHPSDCGRPTIFDKDFIVYTISHIQTQLDAENINKFTPNHTYRFDADELLQNIGRGSKRRICESSDRWNDFKIAAKRLMGSYLETSIEFGGTTLNSGRQFVHEYDLIRDKATGKVVFIIKLSDWIYQSIVNPYVKSSILTINQDYFRIENGLKRRLYEIIRKNMGEFTSGKNKPRAFWQITLFDLQILCGSTATLRGFKRSVVQIIDDLKDQCCAGCKESRCSAKNCSASDCKTCNERCSAKNCKMKKAKLLRWNISIGKDSFGKDLFYVCNPRRLFTEKSLRGIGEMIRHSQMP